MFRFSLRNVFAAVALIAVVCAALAKPSYFWASAVWTLAIAVLTSSLVGYFYCRGRSRAFAAGFALFGWGHMFLFIAPWFDTRAGALLFTRTIVDAAAAMLRHQVYQDALTSSVWEFLLLANQQTHRANLGPLYEYLCFLIVGQSLMTLAVGWFGGMVGQYFSRRSDGGGT